MQNSEEQFIKSVELYHESTGFNIDDTIKHLEATLYVGIDKSFDGSLVVFHYPALIVIAGVGGLTFFRGFNNATSK